MPYFTEDVKGEVQIITKEKQLKELLAEHMRNYPYEIDRHRTEEYLHRHVGPQDGKAIQRLISMLQAIGKYHARADCLEEVLGKIYQIE